MYTRRPRVKCIRRIGKRRVGRVGTTRGDIYRGRGTWCLRVRGRYRLPRAPPSAVPRLAKTPRTPRSGGIVVRSSEPPLAIYTAYYKEITRPFTAPIRTFIIILFELRHPRVVWTPADDLLFISYGRDEYARHERLCR